MSKDEFNIWLTKRSVDSNWVIRYVDPESGRTLQKTTGTKNKKEAERQLGELRADLINNRYQPTSNIAWADFRRRYEDEVLPSLALKTSLKTATVFKKVEDVLQPAKLRDLTSERLSYFQSKLRESGLAETSIAGYLAHLRAALNWAVSVELLTRLPKIQKPKRAKSGKIMKGRPITQEEFQRMLDSVVDVVGNKGAPSWKHYLEGLWWSGLRLAESLELYWDDDSKLCVTNVGNDFMLRIPADLEKGNKDRLLPLSPEFVEFLLKTPEAKRTGRVFTPKATKVRGECLTVDRVSRIISKIGRAANVIVDQAKDKPATAHDLRRSFGERWSARVMPQVLMELMRHESIDTTLKYYVGRNAQRTAKLLREAYEQVKKDKPEEAENDSRDTLRDTQEPDEEKE